jgi:hypothetical protein
MRLLLTLLAVAAAGYAVWTAQWSYVREGTERVNRITGRRQIQMCRKEGAPHMTLEEKKRTLATLGIKVDPSATEIDPVHEELLRSRLAAQQLRTICTYEDRP